MMPLGIRGIWVVVLGVCVIWAAFSLMARNEYVASVRRRLEIRRVDLHMERITVSDAHTIRLLEETAAGENPRQAAYAIGMLAEAPGYDARPLLLALEHSPARQVQEKIYEVAAGLNFDGLMEPAMAKIHAAQYGEFRTGYRLQHAVVAYAVTVSPQRPALAAELLNSNSPEVVYGALEGLRTDHSLAKDLISRDWLEQMASSEDASRRELAAIAAGVRGDEGTEVLHRLLHDPETEPAVAACRSAGLLRSRAYLDDLVKALGRSCVRAAAIKGLASYGPSICGALGDVLMDETVPLRVRRQLPRVLKNIPHQRSVDALLPVIGHQDVLLRTAVLKALNGLRETSPQLRFDSRVMTAQFLSEAHYYFELNAALESLRERSGGPRSVTGLLIRTIEGRLSETLERLFRLLGLRYPPREIYTTYRAVSRPGSEEAVAAVEFLDSTLEPNLKRILLPLLDAPEYALDRGRELFGVEPAPLEEVLRTLIGTGDAWLRLCAIAATT
jgi:AAA family ATP:ADP antiporter